MNIDQYFHHIDRHVHEAYDLANAARALGYDPEDIVAVPLAKNMAERVVGLISVVAPQIKDCGVDVRIRSLEEQYGVQDWRVALTIALEVAQQKFCSFQNQHQAMEVGIRTGIAYVTNGVVSSPLEGFTKLDLRKRRDGQPYAALYFSGPIRSAGGTGASVSVLIGDYVVRHFGCQPYDPTDEEVKRTVTELYDYHERITNLQYLPSEEEIQYMVTHLPVQIEGDPSEKIDVSNYKGLDRINTDKIRNGPCLVLGEGICQKAAKLNKQLSKWGENFGLGHWAFLQDFITLQKKIKAKLVKVQEDSSLLKPDYTFIKDIVAGRPVLTHPLARGGFRLRYGRCRTSGFSTDAIHPATMVVLNNYIAIGTQLKTERPGKSTVIASCDSLEGPIVKLANGNVLRLETVDQAKHVVKDIEEILYLGDILISHGDFLDRVHLLIPAGYCEEWWALELEKALLEKKPETLPVLQSRVDTFVQQPLHISPSFLEALALTTALEIPLHPRYTYHWTEITTEQFRQIYTLLTTKASVTDEKIIFPIRTQDLASDGIKRALELLGVPHSYVSHEYVVVEGEWAQALFYSFQQPRLAETTVLAMTNPLLHLRDKSGTTIGARMGRPEKAKMRKLTGSPQVLFPVGRQGGRLRSFQAALEQGKVTGEFSLYFCPTCNAETIYRVCEMCRTRTLKKYFCRTCGMTDKQQCHGESLAYKRFEIDIRRYMTSALKLANIKQLPELIKGVRGTSNEDHTPEHLVKGILRAHHHIYANKDGTTRYDMTEMPLTHFKPKEVGTSIEKLKELGYLQDIHGQDLVSDGQILEIKPQDVILPNSEESLEAGSQKVLYDVANFIDDLLVHLYQQRPYYSFKKSSELVGHLVVALSPHTSAGIVGRIIGFSKTQGFLTHPSFHSIMRRDCDGDEACVILLMDLFLNFSRKYLPTHRGSTQDAPLVLTSKLIPKEVDDMVFNMDVSWKYPLALYEAALQYKAPWEVDIDRMGKHLGTPREYEGFGFTHDTSDLNFGVRCSSYKYLPTMAEKLHGQMILAEKIRAVETDAVAALVIERHFIRDIRGNLTKFSKQQFRCVGCNEKFRRPPLAGTCTKCEGKIIFTISQGSIIKYLQPSLDLIKKYNVSPYLKQNLELTQMRIESLFGKEAEKQEGLGKWVEGS